MVCKTSIEYTYSILKMTSYIANHTVANRRKCLSLKEIYGLFGLFWQQHDAQWAEVVNFGLREN